MTVAAETPGTQTILPTLVSLAFVVMAGRPYINFLKRRYMGQYIREDGPESHQSKAGTPTAGGVLILLALIFGLMIPALFQQEQFLNPRVLSVAAVTLVFGLLGFVDDYLKISKRKNKGVSGYTKLAVQILVGLAVGGLALQENPAGSVDFFGLFSFELGLLYPVFAAFVVTGTSNAVNLTDGLDGLATGTAILSFMTFALILNGLGRPDLALVGHILTGACLGFLYYNRYPARVFMGDTGSLALGGALGAIAVVSHLEFALVLLGAIYVVEALSVIIQVVSFKTTGKRVFRMSPLHHHFELGGWKEPKVVYSFVTFQFLCCVLAVFLYNRAV